MRSFLSRRRASALALCLVALSTRAARAGIYGFNSTTGDWVVAANWTDAAGNNNSAPGPSDDAYVGSTYPAGALSSATASLFDSVPVSHLYIGYTATDTGILTLQSGGLLTTQYLFLHSATSAVQHSGGFIKVKNVELDNGSSLSLVSGDAVNTNGSFSLFNASTLNFNNSSAGTVYFTSVWDGSNLNLQGGTFLTQYLQLGSTTSGTVTRSGGLLNVQSIAYLYAGSILDLAAGDVFANAIVNVVDASTLKLHGNTLTAITLNVSNGTIDRTGGNISVANLGVA